MTFTTILQPKSIDAFIGQRDILATDKPLYKMIKNKNIPNIFLFGPPGCGKTTLGKIIANEIGYTFYLMNGTSFKVEDFREILKKHEHSLLKAVVFIDEVHRLSKNQQELLLPCMENDRIKIIGASTENPFFTLTNAIRSRSFLFEMKLLNNDELTVVLELAIKHSQNTITDEAKEYLISSSNGDARSLLNLFEVASSIEQEITLSTINGLRSKKQIDGSSNDDSHYDLISAMIKSIRGSDIDAGLYYLARLLNGGEDVAFLARRLVILASEDIGNANPNALNLAVSTMQSVEKIGMPEARIILSQCVVYLASSPKSNSSYLAINEAMQYAEKNILPIPKHIKTHSKEYLYPHNFGGFVEQTYVEFNQKFYNPQMIGFEKTLDEWNTKIKTKGK